jgi:hypothetical protein
MPIAALGLSGYCNGYRATIAVICNSIGHPSHGDDGRTLVEGGLIPDRREEPALVVDLLGDDRLIKQFLRVEEAAGWRFIGARLDT